MSTLLHKSELVLPLHHNTHGIFEESSDNEKSWHGWNIWFQRLAHFIKDIFKLSTEFFYLFFDTRHILFLSLKNVKCRIYKREKREKRKSKAGELLFTRNATQKDAHLCLLWIPIIILSNDIVPHQNWM